MLGKIKIKDGQQPFEVYFPLPFHFDENLPFYILDNNKRPLFSWFVNASNDTKKKMVDVDTSRQTWNVSNSHILADNKNILVVRGWGRLTDIGGYHLNAVEAIKIQDNLLDYVYNRLIE